MNEDISEDPRCKVCGGPVMWRNRLQICTRTDACRRKRDHLRREAKAQALPVRPVAKCKREGCPGKREMLGYCQMHGQRFRRTGDPGPVGRIWEPVVIHAGDVFAEWTALEDWDAKAKKNRRVLCRCSCGIERTVFVGGLTNGLSKSCGHGAPGGARRARRNRTDPYLRAGQVFGRLALLADAPRSTDYVPCRCECGAEVQRVASCVKHGTTTSCGCARNRHGLSTHPLYATWRMMVDRTSNPTSSSYESYGGRGISLCERWQGLPQGFLNFVADVGERPPGMTLDRENNDRGYGPDNVRWADSRTQGLNRRSIDALTRERDALKAELLAAKATTPSAPRPRLAILAQAETLF